MKKLLIIALLLLPTIAFAGPESVYRDVSGQFIRPLKIVDSIKAAFFTATSTATSTFTGGIQASDFCTSLRCLSSVSTGAGLNYWTNSGATTTLNTGSVVEAGSFNATSTTNPSSFKGVEIVGSLKIASSSNNSIIIGDVSGNNRGSYAIDLQSLHNTPADIASGDSSVAIGTNQKATGINSTSIGTVNQALADYSTAIGYGNLAVETDSTAIGASAAAEGANATAIGSNVSVTGTGSIIIGYNSSANSFGDYTTTIGSNLTNNTAGSVMVGSSDSTKTTILSTGFTGLASSSPGTFFSIGDTGANTINISPTATSTFGTGINLRSGCFAISGTCIGGGSSTGVTGGTAGMLAAFVDATTLTATSAPTAGYYVATSSTASAFTKLTLTPLSVGTSLDIFDGSASGSIRLGADVNNSTRSSNVRKLASITAPDYGNTRNIEFISSDSDGSGTNKVYLGGRSGASTYAATDLYLNTATNPSTTGGTTAVYINSSGNVGIGTTTLLSNTQLTVGPTATNEVPLALKGVTSQSSNFVEIKNSAGTTISRISPAGGVLIGSGAGAGYTYASPNAPQLDISWGGVPNAFILGAEQNLSTRTHNTTKVGRIALAPYSTNSLALNIFGGASNVSSNLLTFGGGTSVLQAATQVDFYTAVATNTPTGTSRMTITNTGKTGINLTTPDTELHVSTSTLARATAGTVELLKLSLPTNGGVSYPQAASFAVGTYSSNSVANGYGPDTRLDVKLKTTSSGDYTTGLTVMSWLDNGNVGVGTTSPTTNLQVNGTTATSTLSATVVNGATRSTTLGGKIILQDMAGGTCTEITTQSGAISSRAVTCP